MLRNVSIIRKGLLVLLLPLLCQALILALLLDRHAKQEQTQRWAVHTKDVLLQIDRITADTLLLQGSLLGYAATGSEEFAEDEQAVLLRVGPLTEQLRLLVADNPAQQKRAASIQARAQKRIQWNTEVSELLHAGRREEALAIISTLEGKRMINQLLEEVESFRDTEERLDRSRLAQMEAGARAQNRLLIAGLVGTVPVGLTAILLLNRGLTRRIAILSENSRRFVRGEPLVPIGDSADEIGQLDRNFHEMAEAIAEAQNTERKLQSTLEKQNQELVGANLDLDHKNRENEMFVYSVSHDLRSPLVNLQGFSKELGVARDALKVMLASEMDEAARARALKIIERDVSEPIRFIQTAVMRLSAIIDALLRLSRVGRIEYKGEPVDLAVTIQRIIDALRIQIAEKGVTIQVQELPKAWADATAIEQIFANLIVNAVNYLDPARPGQIEIGVLSEPDAELEGMQVFFVKDNGLGIPEAYLSKVFTIFQRLHGNIAPGEGIGLALVRRMVERHGGKIWVTSEQKVGSTFFVALPLFEKSPLNVAPRKESVRLAGSSTTPGPNS